MVRAIIAHEQRSLRHPRVARRDHIRHFWIEVWLFDSRTASSFERSLAAYAPSERARWLLLVADDARRT